MTNLTYVYILYVILYLFIIYLLAIIKLQPHHEIIQTTDDIRSNKTPSTYFDELKGCSHTAAGALTLLLVVEWWK